MFVAFAALAFGITAIQDYRTDLNFLIESLRQNGAYVREDHVDLDRIRTRYSARFAHVADKRQLLSLLESVVGELHDFHATLGTNNSSSPRLVPSGTDLFAHWSEHHAMVDEVRPGSLAEKNGIKAGDEIVRINNNPTRIECKTWIGVREPDGRGWDWALNSALAGRWDTGRMLTVSHNGAKREVHMASALNPEPKTLLTVEQRTGSVLYLRPENCLGDNGLISAFDRNVRAMRAAKKVVIDLRNTPSGGNSSVARGIMGLFVGSRLPFQRHRLEERDTDTVRDWVEFVTPRLLTPVRTPLFVLVDHWTGSMGEGIAMGFDSLHRATVIGTDMARLRGAVERINLPQSGISIAFPTEKVFNINGTPRHEWRAPIKVIPGPGDPWLAAMDR